MGHAVLRRATALVLVVLATLAGAATAHAARYLVVYRGHEVPPGAARQIEDDGGTLVWTYDRIGVAVADSEDPGFPARLESGQMVAGGPAPELDQPAGPDVLPAAAPRDPGNLPDDPAADDDTFSPFQWGLRQIGGDEAHAVTGGSPSVLVGDIDSGVDYEHPDLTPNLDLENSVSCAAGVPTQAPDPVTGRLPFDDTVGHGTQTAGIIAADDDGFGIVGVAPNVRLAAIKVTQGQTISPQAAVCGFMWAADHGFDVVNSSLAVDRLEPTVPPSMVGFYCRSNPADVAPMVAVARAVEYARQHGVTVVASAGNTGVDLTDPPAGRGCIRMPGGLPGVIAVSSDSAVRQKTFNSNYGLGAIDLTAPGGDPLQPALPPEVPAATGQNLTTYPHALPAPREDNGGKYQNQFGTSAAAPYVTGVAALVISRFGTDGPDGGDARMRPDAVRSILLRTATPVACPPNPYVRVVVAPPPFGGTWTATCDGTDELNGFYGSGEVNALAAVTVPAAGAAMP